MWDVGDINWWWRDGGYENPETQLFLESGDGRETLAMILLSEQYSTFDYEMRPGLERTETRLAAFVEALGGTVEITATFGDRKLVISSSGPAEP